MSEIQQQFWKFLRGDMPTAEFENWIYNTPELETVFDPDSYLSLISSDYRDAHVVRKVKSAFKSIIEVKFPRKCDCITWKNEQELPLVYATINLFDNYEILLRRTPWLELIRCSSCSTCWYLAIDTVDDDYKFVRLSEVDVDNILKRNKWPSNFDNFENVWPSDE